jgi:hypothetical protein
MDLGANLHILDKDKLCPFFISLIKGSSEITKLLFPEIIKFKQNPHKNSLSDIYLKSIYSIFV